MGRPTVTSAYLRHEADARLSSDVHVWGILRAAANTIDEADAALAELRREVQLFMQAFDNEGPSVTGGALRNLRAAIHQEEQR